MAPCPGTFILWSSRQSLELRGQLCELLLPWPQLRAMTRVRSLPKPRMLSGQQLTRQIAKALGSSCRETRVCGGFSWLAAS